MKAQTHVWASLYKCGLGANICRQWCFWETGGTD